MAISEGTKDIGSGMLLAVVAAFAYSLLVCWLIVAMEAVPVKLAAYFLLLALWFVLPMGAFLGAHLPRLLTPLNRTSAMKKGLQWGAVAGTGCGIVWAVELSVLFHDITVMWSAFFFTITMGIYSGCCVSLAALKYANKS